MKPSIGAVLFHREGSNPYHYDPENDYSIGDKRASALRTYRDTGTLPKGIVVWDDTNRTPITSPDQIDWSGMRK